MNTKRRLTHTEADTFGKRIKYYRNMRGLSTYKLAAILGVGHNTVTQTELGRHMPNVPRIQQYAQALGVQAGDLFPEGWNAPRRKTYTLQQEKKEPRHSYDDSIC